MDKQNQSLDVQATEIAKAYMGELAIPTVWLGISSTLIFIGCLSAYVLEAIPFFAALVPLSLATYAIYTVFHDAVHRSIQGKHRHLSWLNEGLGYLAGQLLLVPLTIHRRSHIAHHAHTNDKETDPDFPYHSVVQSIGHLFYFAARSGFDQYAFYFRNCWNTASRQEKNKVAIETLIALSWRLAFIVYGPWAEVLSLLVLSAMLGSMITIYFFAYLVHRPYDAIGRWVDTGSHVFRGNWGAVVDWLWLFQNYHAIHHLYPRIAFYRYRQLFDDIETIMIAKGSPITYYGAAVKPEQAVPTNNG